MENFTAHSVNLNSTQFASSDALSKIFDALPKINELMNNPDIFIVAAFARTLGRPGLLDLYKEPVKYISANAVNFSADLNYKLLSKISTLFTDRINNIIQLSGSSTFYNQLVEPLNFFTTVGGRPSLNSTLPPTPVINLLSLLPHTMFLYYTTKKVKNNVAGIFSSLHILSKGMITGKWAHQINRTNSPESQGYNMWVKISREYSLCGLGGDILSQSFFAAIWGALAFSTHKGMSNGIEATESLPAQHAFNLLTTTIVLSQFLPISRIWNRIKAQPQQSLPHHSPSFDTHDNALADIKHNPYTYAKPQENPYNSTKSNHSIQTYDPIALEKRRQEIEKRDNSSSTTYSSNINYGFSDNYP